MDVSEARLYKKPAFEFLQNHGNVKMVLVVRSDLQMGTPLLIDQCTILRSVGSYAFYLLSLQAKAKSLLSAAMRRWVLS
jgi:peptidyl-tRNA hydrolase